MFGEGYTKKRNLYVKTWKQKSFAHLEKHKEPWRVGWLVQIALVHYDER